MSNKTNTMTRAQAIAIAIESVTNEEARNILEKMHAQLVKPRAKSNTPSKARIQNETLARAMADAIAAKGEPVNTKWICEHVSGILTPQKATAVCRVAVDLELIERQKDGKTVTYTA